MYGFFVFAVRKIRQKEMYEHNYCRSSLCQCRKQPERMIHTVTCFFCHSFANTNWKGRWKWGWQQMNRPSEISFSADSEVMASLEWQPFSTEILMADFSIWYRNSLWEAKKTRDHKSTFSLIASSQDSRHLSSNRLHPYPHPHPFFCSSSRLMRDVSPVHTPFFVTLRFFEKYFQLVIFLGWIGNKQHPDITQPRVDKTLFLYSLFSAWVNQRYWRSNST